MEELLRIRTSVLHQSASGYRPPDGNPIEVPEHRLTRCCGTGGLPSQLSNIYHLSVSLQVSSDIIPETLVVGSFSNFQRGRSTGSRGQGPPDFGPMGLRKKWFRSSTPPKWGSCPSPLPPAVACCLYIQYCMSASINSEW